MDGSAAGRNGHSTDGAPVGDQARNGSWNGTAGGRSNGTASSTASGANGSDPERNGTSNVAHRGAAATDDRQLHGRLKVWIDQDLCTGDGICTDHAPEVFMILEDGIAYCREGDKTFNDPGGAAELAVVPVSREAAVIDAAAECPGECIFIEFEELPELDD